MVFLTVGIVLAIASGLAVASGLRHLAIVVVFIAAVGFLLLGLTRTLQEEVGRRADTRLVPPVPPPSRDTLASLREPVAACPECGTTDLLDAVRGQPTHMVECPRCAFLGAPRIFAHKEEYAQFVRALPR
jgi:Zn ribbon nucleic-acid-binding protein